VTSYSVEGKRRVGFDAGSPLGLMVGQVLVVGLGERELPWGLLKVYIDARYLGRYVIVDDDAAREVRRAWAASYSHLVAPKPDPEKVFLDADGEPSLIEVFP
jgi:hypothetical protein